MDIYVDPVPCHRHKCGSCGRVWLHPDEGRRGDRAAHRCPNSKCRKTQWYRYFGHEPPAGGSTEGGIRTKFFAAVREENERIAATTDRGGHLPHPISCTIGKTMGGWELRVEFDALPEVFTVAATPGLPLNVIGEKFVTRIVRRVAESVPDVRVAGFVPDDVAARTAAAADRRPPPGPTKKRRVNR